MVWVDLVLSLGVVAATGPQPAATMNSEYYPIPDSTDAEPLLELDGETLRGQVPEHVLEKFRDGARFSVVYDGGTLRLQEVKLR